MLAYDLLLYKGLSSAQYFGAYCGFSSLFPWLICFEGGETGGVWLWSLPSCRYSMQIFLRFVINLQFVASGTACGTCIGSGTSSQLSHPHLHPLCGGLLSCGALSSWLSSLVFFVALQNNGSMTLAKGTLSRNGPIMTEIRILHLSRPITTHWWAYSSLPWSTKIVISRHGLRRGPCKLWQTDLCKQR